MRWLDGITNAMNMNLGKLQEMVKDGEAWHALVHGFSKSWTQLGDSTTAISISYKWNHAMFVFLCVTSLFHVT